MDIAGWSHWEAIFDKDGGMVPADRAALVDAVAGAGLTDVIFFSHGWNNSRDGAAEFYKRFLGLLPGLLPAGSAARVGTVGVFWPSMLWPDEAAPGVDAGGAAAFDADPLPAVREFYDDPAQQAIVDQLRALLAARPTDEPALNKFHDLMRQLAQTEPAGDNPEDNGAEQMLADQPRDVAERFASALDDLLGGAPASDVDADEGGAAVLSGSVAVVDDDQPAAGFRDITHRVWDGAKEALRQVTYWQMKNRAGVVGEHGLGAVIRDLHGRQPALRVHLIGHSFGARLVSFALRAMEPAPASAVKSVLLLEGAFSHYAFATELPFDPGRGGVLAGMLSRVDGPLVACFSTKDTAVGVLYPLASRASGTDAAGLIDDLRERWGGIGFDGAQAVGARSGPIRAAGSAYPLTRGGFTNVDASTIVAAGGPPSGAHSDIHHPEIAWLALSAASLT